MPDYLVDQARLRELIEDKCLQQWKAAEVLGVSVSCVERNCKRLGLKTQRTGPRSGAGHTNWRGGRKFDGKYWHVWDPGHPNSTKSGYVAEHRKVMSAKIGRALTKNEVVHHIDGNPQNNDPSNLMIFQTNAAHLKHELTGRMPNWSEEGMERIQEGLERSKIRRMSKRGGQERTQTISRQSETP